MKVCKAHGVPDCGECAESAARKLMQMVDASAALKKKTNTEIGLLIYDHIINVSDMFSPSMQLLEEAADRLIQPECPHTPKFCGNRDVTKGKVYEMWQCDKCGQIWDEEPTKGNDAKNRDNSSTKR